MGDRRTSAQAAHSGLRFGEFTLDLDRAALLRLGKIVKLRPQSFDVLRHLAERHGRLVHKQEILDTIWGDTAVTDDSLTHCLIDIRKAIGDSERSMIRTVPRRGFVFEIPVESVELPEHQPRQRSSFKLSASGKAAAVLVAIALFAGLALRPAIDPGAAVDSVVYDAADDLFQYGRFLFHRRSAGDVETAQRHLLHAVELEPGHARAWATLAGTYYIEAAQAGRERSELLAKLKVAAEEAVAIDPGLAEGWVRLSGYYRLTGDLEAAERLFRNATEAQANEPLILAMSAGKHLFRGEYETAIKLQEKALAQNPLSAIDRINLSFFLMAAGRYEEALEENLRAHELLPDSGWDPLEGFALILLERFEEALAVVKGWPERPSKAAALAMTYHGLGDVEASLRAGASLQQPESIEAYVRMAELLAFCRLIDESFETLWQMQSRFADQAIVRIDQSGMMDELYTSPFLASLRNDERWHAWLESLRANTEFRGCTTAGCRVLASR
jgi:DNA-binding winged helix-turn-helix (wHTH) protein/Tfp pilus assembly protein PilF